MDWISIAALIAGTAAQGEQMRQQASVQEKQARLSGAATKASAKETRASAIFEEQRFRKEGLRRLAEIEALFADAGVGIEDMSTNAILDAKHEIEQDALLIRTGGQFEAEQLEREAYYQYKQEKAAKKQAGKFLGIF